MKHYTDSGAIVSSCMRYRCSLWRVWDAQLPPVCFVMLNPSTADANVDDPTIRKCVAFATKWGYGGLDVVNLFAWRATDPAQLRRVSFCEANHPQNDIAIEHIVKNVEKNGGITVLAWGDQAKHYGMRPTEVVRIIERITKPYVLRLTKGGFPAHPLYLPGDLVPVPTA